MLIITYSNITVIDFLKSQPDCIVILWRSGPWFGRIRELAVPFRWWIRINPLDHANTWHFSSWARGLIKKHICLHTVWSIGRISSYWLWVFSLLLLIAEFVSWGKANHKLPILFTAWTSRPLRIFPSRGFFRALLEINS